MILPPAVEFGARLVVLLVTLAAAVALAREPGRGAFARVTGTLGFLALAAAETVVGAGLVGEGDPLQAWIRLGGYAVLLVAALPAAAPTSGSAAAVAPVPGGAITPAVAGLAAGLLTAVRRRRLPAGPWLGVGVMLFGAADLVEGLDRDWAGAASIGIRVAGAVAVARSVLAITRYRLRLRFLAGFTGLLLAVVLLVSVAIGTVIDRNLREGAFDRLVGQAEDAQRNLVDLASDEVRRLVVLGEVRRIADTIRAGGAVPGSLIRELRDRLLPDVDLVLFLDRRGAIRGRTGVDAARAFEVVGTQAVDFAIREGTEVSSLDALSGGGLALLGVAPIRLEGATAPAGFAVAGFIVDEELLEREVIVGRDTRAVALQGFRGSPPELVAAAGFSEESPTVPTDVLRRAFLAFLEGREIESRTVQLGGAEHFAALTPLRQEVGRPVGILVVAEPAGVVAATRRAVNEVLFVVAVAVIGLAFLVALLAARRITRPLGKLTEAARRVQAGDLAATADVRGEDEVADLSKAFNRMTGSVATMTEELRIAAAEQSRLRARLETVLDSMGDGLLAVDPEGIVATSNPAAASLLGRPRDEVAGLPLRETLVGHDATGRSLEDIAWSPEGLAFVERPDGGEVPVAISSAPLRDADGERIGRVYVLRDMSFEYQVERMKREFLANVSHELRTPLTPIIGYSELMMKRDIPGAQSKEFAASILESARRLERIVAMLVDFSAIEAGRLPVVTEPLEVSPVLDEAATAWRRRSERHRFDIDVTGSLPAAQVNPSLFRRMLDELVDNAVKYSPEGGRVRIAATSRNSNGRPMLSIEVSDEGIGIEPDSLTGIFEGFSQVDSSDTRSFGGLGLGLTFVKRLAEAHGGAVSAESAPGRGSTFRFTVPAAENLRERF